MNALTFPKREPKRSRVFLTGQVDAGSGPIDVRIRDISTTGALLESDFAPKGGDTLELACGSTSLQARVAWADRGWFGVEFFTPLLVGDLVDAAGTKLQVSAPRSYHSGEPLD
ncbi:MAG TPA: PilZ domain-containing protein [Sphingomicrobium sp.]|nr:PilZ domain-containing protein [Sphingomicrobium sp.]